MQMNLPKVLSSFLCLEAVSVFASFSYAAVAQDVAAVPKVTPTSATSPLSPQKSASPLYDKDKAQLRERDDTSATSPLSPQKSASPLYDKDKAQLRERDLELGESASQFGSTGLLHTLHAQSRSQGQFQLQFTTDFVSSNFLCSRDKPCPNPSTLGGPKVIEETLGHAGATLSLSASILKWLELSAAIRAYSNSDGGASPTVLQVIGDTTLSAKLHTRLSDLLYVGAQADLLLLGNVGSVGFLGGATSAKFHGILTLDLRKNESRTPLRFSVNTSYFLDNSGAVIDETESSRGNPVSRIERYSLGINRVDSLSFRLGGEVFLFGDRIRPLLEYGFDVPINRQGYGCRPNNPSGDSCLKYDTVIPGRLTAGFRAYPWKPGFSLTAAIDVGITGRSTFVEELAPETPWMLYLGAGWAVDTFDRPPVVKLVQAAVEQKKGKIRGYVHESAAVDANTKSVPVSNAVVKFSDPSYVNAFVKTDPEGHFESWNLEPGQYSFLVSAEGYRSNECRGEVRTEGGDSILDCSLEAVAQSGTLIGHVKNTLGQAVANATVKVKAANNQIDIRTTNSSGDFKIENIPQGSVEVVAQANGYLNGLATISLQTRKENSLDITLEKNMGLIKLQKKEIQLKRQVQFTPNSSDILPESSGLIAEIADMLVSHPELTQIEIQGHTDNSGSTEKNRALSLARADAVKQKLIERGVPGSRLVTKGYGGSLPLVPNVTAGNRARNRRVRLVILNKNSEVLATDGMNGSQKNLKVKKVKK